MGTDRSNGTEIPGRPRIPVGAFMERKGIILGWPKERDRKGGEQSCFTGSRLILDFCALLWLQHLQNDMKETGEDPEASDKHD